MMRQAVVIEAADRVALNGFTGAGIVEDEDGAPPRCEVGERRHRREHRVFVVFARRDDPHVDPFTRHDRTEQGVESLLDPRRDEIVLLTMGEHALRGIRIPSGLRLERDRGQQNCQGNQSSKHGG